jgi:DNA-binding NtrC family response regulator
VLAHGGPFAVACVDLGLGDIDGRDLIRHLVAADRHLPVVVITADRETDTAVAAMRSGAYDYVVKPLGRERLVQSVANALERRRLVEQVSRLEDELGASRAFASIIGEAPALKELLGQVQRVLDSDVAVCLNGESGTGKELVARAVHEGGRRRAGPFVALNCAAIPPSLQESELFGHERGAFTGAIAMRRGCFEQARGGTLFLDEVGEMSPSTQAALLRALQERVIRRVGGTAEIPVDVRIVCATHRDLGIAVQEGRFREDLYYRLVVFPIRVPPLRERREDIPPLVGHFLHKHRPDVGRDIGRVSPDAIEAMVRHPWPGNVRELGNVVHRAMLSCDGEELRLGDLPPELRALALSPVPRPSVVPPPPAVPAFEPGPATELEASDQIIEMRELEARAIRHAIRATGGNVAQAAKRLGIGRATIYRRLEELGGERSKS